MEARDQDAVLGDAGALGGAWPSREPRHRCPHCGKDFTRPTILSNHIQTVHEGKKPFVCKTCGRTYAWNVDLKRHEERQHMDGKPVQCQYCHREYTRNSTLHQHIRDKHASSPHIAATGSRARRDSRRRTNESPCHTSSSNTPQRSPAAPPEQYCPPVLIPNPADYGSSSHTSDRESDDNPSLAADPRTFEIQRLRRALHERDVVINELRGQLGQYPPPLGFSVPTVATGSYGGMESDPSAPQTAIDQTWMSDSGQLMFADLNMQDGLNFASHIAGGQAGPVQRSQWPLNSYPDMLDGVGAGPPVVAMGEASHLGSRANSSRGMTAPPSPAGRAQPHQHSNKGKQPSKPRRR